jgi:putative membrane protein
MINLLAQDEPMEKRRRIATGIALAFHISGLIAIGIFKSQLFIDLTPLNLLVCAALVIYTQQAPLQNFLVFAAAAFVLGFAAEYVGVNTGFLFGEYQYGTVLGPKWNNGEIPWLNYLSWYGVSLLILFIFHKLSFDRGNLFAVHLLLIQFMFFLALRTIIRWTW